MACASVRPSYDGHMGPVLKCDTPGPAAAGEETRKLLLRADASRPGAVTVGLGARPVRSVFGLSPGVIIFRARPEWTAEAGMRAPLPRWEIDGHTVAARPARPERAERER